MPGQAQIAFTFVLLAIGYVYYRYTRRKYETEEQRKIRRIKRKIK